MASKGPRRPARVAMHDQRIKSKVQDKQQKHRILAHRRRMAWIDSAPKKVRYIALAIILMMFIAAISVAMKGDVSVQDTGTAAPLTDQEIKQQILEERGQ